LKHKNNTKILLSEHRMRKKESKNYYATLNF
jgi:hypothetical protein